MNMFGERPEGMEGMEFPEGMEEFEGMGNPFQMETETMTITLSKKIKITVDGEKASKEDLEVGDSVQIIVSGDKVETISVINFQNNFKK